MKLFYEKVLSVLVESRALSAEQVRKIRVNFEQANLSFEAYLAQRFKISSVLILQAKSKVAATPQWAYDEEKPIPTSVLREIPPEAAEQYQMVPLAKQAGKLMVGMVDPTDLKGQEALRFVLLRSNFEPSVVTISETDFRKIFILYKGLHKEVKAALQELEKSLDEPGKKPRVQQPSAELVREAPITKMVAVMIKHAIEGKASDIHIEPVAGNTRVRFRVDGVLHTSLLLPLSVHNSIIARIKILTSMRLDESRIPQDGRFSTRVNGKTIDFRVSSFPTSLGEKMAIRVLDPATAVLDLPKLGLVGPNLRLLQKAIINPFGMILATGPTGSGKTTTLYSALTSVNKEEVNVVSLEDPVEYHINGVNQSQVRPEIDYTFAVGLRHILRQDPDIIMVGEIRDTETEKLTTQAALTGHLVFSTLHTNNAIGVIPRLIDMGVEPFLLPSSLALAMAQRLVGKLCPYCKKEKTPHPRLASMIEEELSKLPNEVLAEFKISKPYKVWESEGCARCNQKKTKGRMAIYECLDMTTELKKIILENPTDITIGNEARRQGMLTMKQDGIIKALQGIVSMEDVIRKVEETL